VTPKTNDVGMNSAASAAPDATMAKTGQGLNRYHMILILIIFCIVGGVIYIVTYTDTTKDLPSMANDVGLRAYDLRQDDQPPIDIDSTPIQRLPYMDG
jgi:hypothetical protein